MCVCVWGGGGLHNGRGGKSNFARAKRNGEKCFSHAEVCVCGRGGGGAAPYTLLPTPLRIDNTSQRGIRSALLNVISIIDCIGHFQIYNTSR